MEETMETTRPNNSAHNQLSTEKPSTRLAVHFMISTLITRRNKPSVNTVMGMVKITSMGFIKVFKRASTTATNSAVVTLLM